jgi:hypothetical protein
MSQHQITKDQAIDAYDTLTARITQALAVTECLETQYAQQPVATMVHVMNPRALQNLVWSIRELLDQGKSAADQLGGIDFAALDQRIA